MVLKIERKTFIYEPAPVDRRFPFGFEFVKYEVVLLLEEILLDQHQIMPNEYQKM